MVRGTNGWRNGVGILVVKDLEKYVVEVKKRNDMIMLIRIVVGEEVITIISAYGPKVGLEEQEKRDFWDNLDDLLEVILNDEKLFLGGNFNGHIGTQASGYDRLHDGYGYGVRNESGERLFYLTSW